MRNVQLFSLLLAAVLLLSACAPVDTLLDTLAPTSADQSLPSKMVVQIDVSTNPYDATLARCYTSQEHMSALLRMVQNMGTTDEPADEPKFDSYSQYYTVTATYVGGKLTVYHILDQKYLRAEGEAWCTIDAAKYNEFVQFIANTPDHEIVTEPTAETAASEETTPSEG